MKRIILAITLVGLLGAALGCSSGDVPESSYYLLRAEAPGTLAPADPERSVEFAPVEIAPYLARAGIMVEVGERQVQEAQYHQWAEPLQAGIRAYLSGRVMNLLGRELNAGAGRARAARYRIHMEVEVLHGSLDGEVRMVARWSLRDSKLGEVVATERIARSRKQGPAGYPGLVAAQTALLDQLADSIATALKRADDSAQPDEF